MPSPTSSSSHRSRLPKREGIYLAREIIAASPDYSIRQSYYDSETGTPIHHDLFHLGKNPADFIVPVNECGYYVREDLIQAVEPFVEGDPEKILEELLRPFASREIRHNLDKFGGRGGQIRSPDLTEEEREAIASEIHIFDRRRLHYLWYGTVDQGRLFQMPPKLCRKLLGMSRDQKEQYFLIRERDLKFREIKEYLYTVFNLQQHFSESIARTMPQGLDREKMDEYFLRELCSLREDHSFWQGMGITTELPSYLVRYLVNYFDYDFGPSSTLNDYIRQFIDSRRQHRYPDSKSRMKVSEASTIFSENHEKMKNMSKSELTRLFRRKAKKMHPDAGGRHEDFLKLVEAYERLLRTK